MDAKLLSTELATQRPPKLSAVHHSTNCILKGIGGNA